jgi:hypothetical protein
MSIPFTQFMRPSGRPKPVLIDRPADIETQAGRLIAAGCRFECEVLTTGEVSFTIQRNADEVVACEICPNGPKVPAAVDRLVAAGILAIDKVVGFHSQT